MYALSNVCNYEQFNVPAGSTNTYKPRTGSPCAANCRVCLSYGVSTCRSVNAATPLCIRTHVVPNNFPSTYVCICFRMHSMHVRERACACFLRHQVCSNYRGTADRRKRELGLHKRCRFCFNNPSIAVQCPYLHKSYIMQIIAPSWVIDTQEAHHICSACLWW